MELDALSRKSSTCSTAFASASRSADDILCEIAPTKSTAPVSRPGYGTVRIAGTWLGRTEEKWPRSSVAIVVTRVARRGASLSDNAYPTGSPSAALSTLSSIAPWSRKARQVLGSLGWVNTSDESEWTTWIRFLNRVSQVESLPGALCRSRCCFTGGGRADHGADRRPGAPVAGARRRSEIRRGSCRCRGGGASEPDRNDPQQFKCVSDRPRFARRQGPVGSHVRRLRRSSCAREVACARRDDSTLRTLRSQAGAVPTD